MPKSRRHRPKRNSTEVNGRRALSSQAWGDFEPWARAMVMADEAERRGDAAGALDIMEAFGTGPDGKPFWRPWREDHLFQIAMLDSILPSWVISRWICNQALQALDEGNRGRHDRALDLAIELRGGRGRLPGNDALDALGRVTDRDWVYRQLFLYDRGGLDHFVRRLASPSLLSRADSIQAWVGAGMGGYRLAGRSPDALTWTDVATEEDHITPNLGSGLFVAPGEHVIGRLVPVERGKLFETRPMSVPEAVAGRVAERPQDWFEILRAAMRAPGHPGFVTHGLHHEGLTSDVPTPVWQAALLDGQTVVDPEDEAELDAARLTRMVLSAATAELAAMDDSPAFKQVDPWPCIGAALLSPPVIVSLRDVVEPADLDTLRRLADLLAEPAASLSRQVVREMFEVT